MKHKVWILVVLMMFISGCHDKSDESTSLPNGAYNIVQLGNGWTRFDMPWKNHDGTISHRTFMVMHYISGNAAAAAITEIYEK